MLTTAGLAAAPAIHSFSGSMFLPRSESRWVFLAKAAAIACALGLHLAVVAAILAQPSSVDPARFDSAMQVSMVELLPSINPAYRSETAGIPVVPEPDTDINTTPEQNPSPDSESTANSEGEPTLSTSQGQAERRQTQRGAQLTETGSRPDEPIVRRERTHAENKPILDRVKPTPRREPSGNKGKISRRSESKPVSRSDSNPAPKHTPKPIARKQTAAKPAPIARERSQPSNPANQANAGRVVALATGSVATGSRSGQKTPPGESQPRWVTRVAYQGSPPRPRYPDAALRRGQTGKVVVRVVISPQGNVMNATVERSSGHALLDAAALDAVRRTRFKPYTENGVAYSARADIPIDFVL